MSFLDCSLAFACLLQQVGPLQLARVVRLPVHGDAVESVLQGFTGAGVDHARFDIGVVLVDVGNEGDFGSFALTTFELKFDIVDGIRRSILARLLLLGDELLSESVVVRLFADLVYHDFLLVIGDLVDNVFGSTTVELQLIESRDTVWVDGESGHRHGCGVTIFEAV